MAAPQMPRDPGADKRTRDFTQRIGTIVNSLLALEVIVRTGTETWSLDPMLMDIMDLVDPGADRLLFWDDSGGHLVFLTPGTSIAITTTSIHIQDRNYGDITVTSSGTVWTIGNDAVTNAKLANMAQATVKGRAVGAGTGDPADLTAEELVTLINTADGAGSLLDADLVDGWQLSDIQAFASAMG